MKRLPTILLLLALFTRFTEAGSPAAENPARVLVGINYFAGWWETLPNKWHGKGWTTNEPDWRVEFPDRVPLLGAYNNQTTMDREIAAAAGYGVDFFSILWYFPKPGSRDQAQAKLLNRGLETFLASTNADRMRFMIEYCNAPGFNAVTDEEWTACLQAWIPALKHPACLRVDGRIVFKIHGADQFLRDHGGDLNRCRKKLDVLRSAVRAAGLGEMLIGGGIMSRSQIQPGHPFATVFDYTATYMSIPEVAIRDQEHPYAVLAEEARIARALHAKDPVPWVPYLAAGWNPRPWTHPGADPNHRRFFTQPTSAKWAAELRALRDDFHKFTTLGLPLTGGGRQPMVTLYAWNEFGEGGYVAPTQGAMYSKLEAIRETFGPAQKLADVADRAAYLKRVAQALSVQWPNNRTLHIVCHGHSVPAGYFKTPVVDTFNAYPHLLHRGLKERFPHAVLNVIVTAIGGENSESGARRFERDVLSIRPELITIDYGLNDRGIGLDRANAAWTQMIRMATNAGIKVILLTPTPDMEARLDDPNDPLNQHADQIRRLAREHRLGLVDSLDLFRQRLRAGQNLPELMSQGNHPNRHGHELVANGLLRWFP